MLITHYVACLFGVLPKLEGWLGYAKDFSGGDDAPINWLEAEGIESLSPGTQYTYALYWAAASLTSVGYGDVTGVSLGELLYSVVVMLFGAVVTANIFALFTSLIARLNTQEMQFQMRQEKWAIYMRDRQVPEEVQDKVRRFFEFTWSRGRYMSVEELNQLPAMLKMEILRITHGQMLNQSRVFKTFEAKMAQLIAYGLMQQVAIPREVLVQVGDMSEGLFFVKEGEVALLDPDLDLNMMEVMPGVPTQSVIDTIVDMSTGGESSRGGGILGAIIAPSRRRMSLSRASGRRKLFRGGRRTSAAASVVEAAEAGARTPGLDPGSRPRSRSYGRGRLPRGGMGTGVNFMSSGGS